MVTDPAAIRHPPVCGMREKSLPERQDRGFRLARGLEYFTREYLIALPGAPGPRRLLDLDRSMRNLGRILTIGVLWLVGCSEKTFPLLPEDGGAPMAGGAGAGAGRGGTAGVGAAAGMPGRGGMGGRGAAGSAGMAQGGSGNGSGCPPTGCEPPHCSTPGCIPCASEADCQQKGTTKPHCNSYTNSCVECRYTGDCKDEGRACDQWLYTCMPDCSLGPSYCPDSLPVCSHERGNICVACDDHHECEFPLKCSGLDLCVECTSRSDCNDAKPVCSLSGECVECLSSYDCYDDAKPVCAFNECRPCSSDDECNLGGFNSGMATKVCNKDGRCVDQPP